MTVFFDERSRYSWVAGVGAAALLLGFCTWLVVSDAPVYRFLVRLCWDKEFMQATLRQWRTLAPLVFIVIQALQVVIAPIPGEVTGLLGGFVFGQWLGFFYSTVGLTAGSLLAFWVGRRLGAPYARVCYLFGISPMPFWLFAVASTVGRLPGTWALSAQGAKAAAGEYIELLLLTAIVAAVATPL